MVRIVIVGEGGVAGLIEYPDDSKTEAVEKKLLNGYGMGILMRKGVGVLCETLAAGDYEYYATTPGNLFLMLFVKVTVVCRLSMVYF